MCFYFVMIFFFIFIFVFMLYFIFSRTFKLFLGPKAHLTNSFQLKQAHFKVQFKTISRPIFVNPMQGKYGAQAKLQCGPRGRARSNSSKCLGKGQQKSERHQQQPKLYWSPTIAFLFVLLQNRTNCSRLAGSFLLITSCTPVAMNPQNWRLLLLLLLYVHVMQQLGFCLPHARRFVSASLFCFRPCCLVPSPTSPRF